jgi:hypothetical protein
VSKKKRPAQKPVQVQTAENIKPSLMVAVPAMDMVYTTFCQSLVGLAVPQGTWFHFTRGSLIYDARNLISVAAVEGGVDKVLWVDSDMEFPQDAFVKLSDTMDETGADVVTAIAFTRKDPILPVIYNELKQEQQGDKIHTTRQFYYDYPKDSAFEIAGCGFGFALTRVSMLKKVIEAMGAPFTPRPALGEDLSFCLRVRELGGKIYCDSRVKVAHIGLVHISEGKILLDGEKDDG